MRPSHKGVLYMVNDDTGEHYRPVILRHRTAIKKAWKRAIRLAKRDQRRGHIGLYHQGRWIDKKDDHVD